MNILVANWTWFQSGGDWTYIDSICKLYESRGHNIIPFSVKNENNFKTPFDKYFLTGIDYKVYYNKLTLKTGFNLLLKTIYSTEAKEKLKLLISENKVDIAQLNNINDYHTPSIIPVLKKAKIPVVWRILDFKLICPNNTFLSHGKVCESCYKHKYYNCILKKCKKSSLLASTLMAMESYFYYLMPNYRMVDMFLFQSEFTRDMFVKYGFDIGKTHIIENPFNYQDIKPKYSGAKYILYFGRISAEKGILTLLKAMKSLPEIELKIVGNGPEYDSYVDFISQNFMSNVSFLGPKWNKDLEPYIENCEFVIVPSEWYEPSPYVVLQAFSYGKPVVASNIGGLKDLVIDKTTGSLFKVGDEDSLANSILYLYNDKELIREMGENSRLQVEIKNNPDRYYTDTMSIFNKLINCR
jgi:glycosyltransferase involved in cell wall biosynthesis